MVTSIADLLDQADRESARRNLGPEVAARSLRATERLLVRIQVSTPARSREVRPPDQIDSLHDATRRAAASFSDDAPGRLVDLIDAAGDAAGRLSDNITEADRWMIAVAAASIARRCAAVIADAVPHGQVPELTAVRLTAGRVIRSAARTPPEPSLIRGMNVPVASPAPEVATAAGAAVIEWTGALISYFRNQSRELLTVTQLIGASRAAEHITVALADAGVAGGRELARRWRITRDALNCFADVPDRRRLARSPVLGAARGIDDALNRAAPSDLPAIVRAATYLPLLAREIGVELYRVQSRLVVGGGSRPLSEERVADWLRHRVVPATPPDIGKVQAFLSASGGLPGEPRCNAPGIRPALAYARRYGVGL